jgi:hypothetical protein
VVVDTVVDYRFKFGKVYRVIFGKSISFNGELKVHEDGILVNGFNNLPKVELLIKHRVWSQEILQVPFVERRGELFALHRSCTSAL